MSKQEILEGNKLIAEFMGAVFQEDYSTYIMGYMEDKPHHVLKTMQYHSSWNWLMPVVEKIRMDSNVIAFEICFCLGVTIRVWFNDKWNTYDDSNSLKGIWFAVVEYIKWYNEQVAKQPCH